MRTRDQYVDGLKKQLDFWNAQRELARYNLSLIEDASASAWTELRKGADEAWERMCAAAGAAGGYFEKIPAKARPAARKARGNGQARRASRPAAKRTARAAK